MQKEIDHLKRSLRHARRRRTPSNFDHSSDDEEDEDYNRGQELPLANLSHTMKITAMNAETVFRLREAW